MHEMNGWSVGKGPRLLGWEEKDEGLTTSFISCILEQNYCACALYKEIHEVNF